MRSLLLIVSSVIFAAGCGSTTVPVKDVSQAEASIRAAEEVGAAKVPQAALHVKMAKDQLVVAQKFLANDETELASAALHRSTLDAELAVALAKENATRREATQAGTNAAALQNGAP